MTLLDVTCRDVIEACESNSARRDIPFPAPVVWEWIRVLAHRLEATEQKLELLQKEHDAMSRRLEGG